MRTHSPRPPAIVPLLAAAAAIAWTATGLTMNEAHDLPAAAVHDNREPAGEIRDGVRHLQLRAARAAWRAEGEHGAPRTIEAFGEVGGPLTVPAPLIRVREGETIVASIRNELASPLRVHGLCARDGAPCAALDVPAGEGREVRFSAGRPGTYHYWATSTGTPFTFRASADTQLSGAFIVDPADGRPPEDRVFVITEWTSLTPEQLAHVAAQPEPGATFLSMRPDALFSVNGLSWPHTERLQYALGERVRWRVINLSTQTHPMHLHGFYFDVERQGNGVQDSPLDAGRPSRVVTHLLPPGGTADVAWTPERAGRWLFHCHTMVHVSSTLHVDGSPKADGPHDHRHDPGMGMAGLVLGIDVRAANATRSDADIRPAARRMTLLMRTSPRRFGDDPALGFQLADASGDTHGDVPVPGPVLVVRRDEPVEITLVNELDEATAIHWHGIELESYYDGVHGWSGAGTRTTPMIEPGERFVVRFTPPRAGTFIYHTHLHENRQLTSGLYGALLVIDPEDAFDPEADHVFVVGRGGPSLDAPVVVNGVNAPRSVWRAGTRHRIRLINITPNDTIAVSLRTAAAPVQWRLLAKDGAALDPPRTDTEPASQVIGVGETYDFEYAAPPGRASLWLEVRSPGGKWFSQGRVIVQ